MNIFELYLDKIKSVIVDLNKNNKLEIPENFNGINAEIPPPKFDCDISTNVAMVLSKINKTSPLQLAEKLAPEIKNNDSEIETISVAKPGFINIKFKPSYWSNFIKNITDNADSFGINDKEKKNNYLVEFVSANPTGPLHVGHCRGAILGDVISNVLIFNKHKVTKEYYVNDYGNQIINFTKSVYFRIREVHFKETFPEDNPDLYPGDYLIDFAKNIISNNSDLKFDNFDEIRDKLTVLSIEQALLLIKNNLKSLGIKHDNFVSEKNIVLNNEVESVIDFLEKNNFIYKGKIKAPAGEDNKDWVEREQLLFKSTEFGDDKDRALQKSDGTWTYFASDVAYHKNKVDRNFDYLINILGADHAGYIKRIISSVEALSGKKDTLICKISQLVKLIKDNKPFKMSKRKGDYITVDDLIEEVGRDATRFIMLNRSSDVELDFDFDAVKEKSKDNPLYYVQYCYARISSVFRHIDKDLNSKIELNDFNFEYSNDEIKILKKLSEWPKCIDAASTKLEPHRIPVYLYDLASEFHSYWNLGKQFPEKRFINDQKTVSPDKLIFLKAISNVIKTGMDIVGVDTPNQM
ncbi:arginine--tRNA ligase [Candidatus Pelagibacter sp. HIMB1521]|uniref:arginine--tRNA ligase n=1 Tax=Candidatus Pelagibacter sp. HIMB1521 TaxID=3413344 RepID=UPI003F84C866